jgi:class 3 adenylate cyclase
LGQITLDDSIFHGLIFSSAAARIEKLNKQFGSELLISDRVRQIALGDRIRNAIPKGFVHVRGREEPIQVFQLA